MSFLAISSSFRSSDWLIDFRLRIAKSQTVCHDSPAGWATATKSRPTVATVFPIVRRYRPTVPVLPLGSAPPLWHRPCSTVRAETIHPEMKQKGRCDMDKKSPAGGVSNSYARAGDYTVAQMQSVSTYGYVMYICTFQPALGPVVSSFWLYSNQPAPAFLPDAAQNWRWNEIDFEWVPFTETSQSAYCELQGESIPATLYGTSLDLDAPGAQTLDSGAVSWVEGKVQTDGTIARDMWDYYNVWMTGSNSGAPTGGTFTLTDASCSGNGCTTAP